MKTCSKDTYELNSPLTSPEVMEQLRKHTHESRLLVMKMTPKDFIGRVEDRSFSVISSSFPLPYGAVCVLKGETRGTALILLTTTLHKVFRILYLVWLAIGTGAVLVFWLDDGADAIGGLMVVVPVLVAAVLFRLYLHGMYIWSRNEAVRKLKRVLEVKD